MTGIELVERRLYKAYISFHCVLIFFYAFYLCSTLRPLFPAGLPTQIRHSPSMVADLCALPEKDLYISTASGAPSEAPGSRINAKSIYTARARVYACARAIKFASLIFFFYICKQLVLLLYIFRFMLKLYKVFGHFNNDPNTVFSHYILGYSECHAVNLFYRHYDSMGMLNDVTHHSLCELDVIHPKQINDHEKVL